MTFGFGIKVKNPLGKTGVVTWIGKDFPTGHRTKVKWDKGGTTLTLTATLTEVTP